jgi:hypothetical protein
VQPPQDDVTGHGVQTAPASAPVRGRGALIALIAVSVVSLGVAAALLYSAPPAHLPDVDVPALPTPTPRQQEAFDVLTRFFAAVAAKEADAARTMACANPTGYPLSELQMAQSGNLDAIVHPDAIVDFQDGGTQVTAKVVMRLIPLTDAAKAEAEQTLRDNQGFHYAPYVLTDDGSGLKVCSGG